MKKENKNIFIVILVVIGLFYLMGQGDDVSLTDGLDEDLMNKQTKFSDSPFHIESRLSPMSFEDQEEYMLNRFKKNYVVGGATCSSEPDLSSCLESGLTITCPSSYGGQTNYGCSIDVWTAVDDSCAYDVHETYLGKYDRTPGQQLTLSGEGAYFYDVYMCLDKSCSCGTETNYGCGEYTCDDDEMTRRRICTPTDCGGDYDGWINSGSYWYYCATGFSECIDCDSHDSFTCSNNDIYYYDSCDNREEKKTECGVPGCDYGTTVCLEEEPTEGLTINLDTLAGLKNDYTPGQKVTFGINFDATKTFSSIVLEAQIVSVTSPKKTAIQTISIPSNRCDILSGVTQNPLFRNEKVNINPGDSKLAQFEFTPPNLGRYDVYVDAASDCGVEPDLIPNKYIGSFLVSDSDGGDDEDEDEEDDDTKQKICSTTSDCDASECQECKSGYCISKCAGLLQKCESGECETNSFLIIVGAALLGIIMLGMMSKGKK